jgi:N,N'-diacetyllegionaminate synthase
MVTPNTPIIVFECANAHGGDIQLLRSTIERFGTIGYPEKHIKFQAFHKDTIALPDFSAYNIYEELLFSRQEWSELIRFSVERFNGTWLDIFDRYGVEVFAENHKHIYGIKLQASVLENREVIEGLKQHTLLSGKKLMLNISGHAIETVTQMFDRFSRLRPGEIIFQIGHQAYPTQLKDTGIQKITVLRENFPGIRICIADHVAGDDPFACTVPLLGLAAGCSLVEKHICLDRSTAKYDHFSALEPDEMQVLANQVVSCMDAISGPFISVSEREYLEKSVQVPVAGKSLPRGSLVAASDIIFRRTSQKGSTYSEISGMQQQHHILAADVKANTTVGPEMLKPASVGVLVACRMKSSRLKAKALLPIAGTPSIDICLENCLTIREASTVVLTTSTEKEDNILGNHTLNGRVKFWQGDPDDVMRRYIDTCEAYGIDVVIRVTGDCPVISKEIASFLLSHHFASGADYTAAKQSAVGTACEIYNVEVLKRIVSYVGKAEYSEYMTWYLQNNKDIFKVELVDLPVDLVRDYRLTLDYQEDLDLFNAVFGELERSGLEPNTDNIFRVLDANPAIANLNAHLPLMYKTNQELIDTLNRETRIHKPMLQ